MEFQLKALKIDGDEFKIQIWDTSGQEKYRTVTKSFYRNIMGAVIVFDLTNRESFEHIDIWLDMLRENGPEGTIRILVGNKSDLKGKRVVSEAEIRKKSNDVKVEYFETSAKDGVGINEAFLFIASSIKREKIDDKLNTSQAIKYKESTKNEETEKGKKKGKCC